MTDTAELIEALERIYARANRAGHTSSTQAFELRTELKTVALLARTAIERATLRALHQQGT